MTKDIGMIIDQKAMVLGILLLSSLSCSMRQPVAGNKSDGGWIMDMLPERDKGRAVDTDRPDLLLGRGQLPDVLDASADAPPWRSDAASMGDGSSTDAGPKCLSFSEYYCPPKIPSNDICQSWCPKGFSQYSVYCYYDTMQCECFKSPYVIKYVTAQGTGCDACKNALSKCGF